jgi:hypothetical protein
MNGIVLFEKSEYINKNVVNIKRHNRMWGSEYLLMDSNSFMGSTDGSEYDGIIEIFMNIQNVNGSDYQMNDFLMQI